MIHCSNLILNRNKTQISRHLTSKFHGTGVMSSDPDYCVLT